MPLRIAKPLEAIRPTRTGRVAERESFQGPAVVADHDLVEREPLLLAPNEEVAQDLRDPELDPGLPHKPGVKVAVVHEPCAPGCGQLKTGESSSHDDARITNLLTRVHDDLFFAFCVLSKEQIVMHPGEKVRDSRIIMGGRFPSLKLPTTWCAGFMYDGYLNSWFVRQTGVQFGVPKILSYFFIGRQKEGFSLNKIMVGYDGWTLERFTFSDAPRPRRADGFEWLGYSKRHGFLWNVGYYNDVMSKGQSFSSYSSQEVVR